MLNQIVTQQRMMMAANDFFRLSCLAFIVLADLVRMTKPRRGVSPAPRH
jgi:DHA2 family multidrug resistance protein